jgi:phosphate/phosphite/phosphonate ABC transporter binding protein
LRLGAALLGSPSVLLEAYSRVSEHLSEATGIPVTLVAANDYTEMTDRLETGDIEVAILPPLEYISAKERIPCLNASLTTIQDGHVHYTGYLIVRADSEIRDVRRLAGRSIGFVSPNSASGDLFPRVRLLADGLVPERDMARVDYLGSHLAVIDAVLNGTVDAGATFDAGLELARREGREVGALAILAITGRIPLEAIVIHPTLDTALVERLVDAFAALNTANPEGRRTLAPLGTICGYARSDDRFYDEVRSTLNAFRRLGGESR